MIAALLLAAAAPLAPTTIVTIDAKHRLVEGIATDGAKIYVSSLIDRQILVCRKTCRTFATLPAGLHPFAIAWDASRKRLWVAADCPPGVPFIKACEQGALIGLNAAGRIVTRISPTIGAFHPGDVSASSKGDVFVSDSQNGAIYRLLPKGHALMALIAPGVGKSGQGSVVSADGKQLIAADYSQGVTSIDLASGARTILKREDGRPVRGIDGLTRCGSDYYALYNGATPGMLIRFTVAGERIAFEPVIEGGPVADPTQLVVDGDRLLIVGASGWEQAMKNQPRAAPTPILAAQLPQKCGN